MVQPKTPPLSLRLPPHFIAEIDVWALRNGRNRHAAMVWLMAKGLAEDARRSEVAPGPAIKIQPSPKLKAGDVVTGLGPEPLVVSKVGRNLQLGPTPIKPGDRAKKPGKAKR